MPNWSYNFGKITGSIEELNAIRNFTSFQDIHPRPVQLEERWYEWNNANWGTKWDINDELMFDSSHLDTKGYLHFEFQTAWSPPLLLFAHLCRRFPSLEVKCMYDEESGEYMGISTFDRNSFHDYNFADFTHKTNRAYDEVLERMGRDHSLASDFKDLIWEKRERRNNDFEVEEYCEEEIPEDELCDVDIDVQERHMSLLEYMSSNYENVNVELRPTEFGGVLLPKKYVLKIKRFPELPEDWECGICREGQDERPVLKLRCGGDHIFHSICAKEWGKTKLKRREQTTCPMCARVVSSSGSQEPESQQTPIGMDIE
jgi:hypothetical protein